MRSAGLKILRFFERVAMLLNWFKDEKVKEFPPVKPVTFHLFPSQQCNFNCPHCGYFSVQGLPRIPNSPDPSFLLSEIKEIQPVSIHYSGYGEPTLYEHLKELIPQVSELGVKQFISSNGSGSIELYTQLDSCRISLDAASVKTHMKVHGTNKKTSERVFETVETLLQSRNKVEVGVAFLITPENINEVLEFVEVYSDVADFLQVRPAYGVEFKECETKLVRALSQVLESRPQVSYDYAAWDVWVKQAKQKCYVTPLNVVGFSDDEGFKYSLCQDRLLPRFEPPFSSWWGKEKHQKILRAWSSYGFCSIKCPFVNYNRYFERLLSERCLDLDII